MACLLINYVLLAEDIMTNGN